MARKVDDSEHIKEYDINQHKIMAMGEERRRLIIEAALNEFSKGYTVANTDVIVKKAGISKGLLFHYFGSKRGLFLFLIKYSLNAVLSTYEKHISADNDFLENLKTLSTIKSGMAFQYPQTFGFMIKALPVMHDAFPEGLPKDLPFPPTMWMRAIWKKSNNDSSLFHESIDRKKARDIIIWTINGLSESLLRYGDDVDAYQANYNKLTNEIEEYFYTLRKLFYR